MLDTRTARDRAVRYAITTGHMPNFDLIHARQQAEGFHACFGRCLSACEQRQCRWHRECTELLTFDRAPAEADGPALDAAKQCQGLQSIGFSLPIANRTSLTYRQ